MPVDKDLIQRYHNGTCTAAERQQVEDWLDSAEAEFSFPAEADLNSAEHKGWKKLSARYGFQVPVHHLSPSEDRAERSATRLIWKVAACFIVVAGISLAWLRTDRFQHINSKRADLAVVFKKIRAPRGQKLSVKLSDGTTVFLNSESTLTYPEEFSTHSRKVALTGEAYFEVAKDSAHPFIISTARSDVKVLGTKFNLRAYPSDAIISVVVEEGKVRFSPSLSKESLIVTKGLMGTLHADNTLSSAEVYPDDYISWKRNELLLDNLTVDQITVILSRWYNVQIEVQPVHLKQERYTGSFSNPSLEEVLKSMSFAVKFKYKQERRKVMIF